MKKKELHSGNGFGLWLMLDVKVGVSVPLGKTGMYVCRGTGDRKVTPAWPWGVWCHWGATLETGVVVEQLKLGMLSFVKDAELKTLLTSSWAWLELEVG